MGKLAVTGKFARPVIHRAVRRRVCVSVFDQLFNHLDHAVDFLRRKRMRRRRANVHALHILFALADKAFGHFIGRRAFFHCLPDDFVVHIRKIGYKVYVVALVFQIMPHRIKNNHRPGVSDVDIIVHGWPADVHLYLPFLQWDKFFFLLCQRIV